MVGSARSPHSSRLHGLGFDRAANSRTPLLFHGLPRSSAPASPRRRTVGGRTGIALATALLAACGHDDGGPSPAPTVAISGTIRGIAPGTSVTLTVNGGDPLSVGSDGAFTFATRLDATQSYDIAVAAAPIGGVCTVLYGKGAARSAGTTRIVCGPIPQGRFQATANPSVVRDGGPKLVPLRDGSVLAFGGTASAVPVRLVERYDPSADRWTSPGALPGTFSIVDAFATPDDKVLLIASAANQESKITIYRYDPVTATTTSRASAATLTTAFAVALLDGRILACDGSVVEIYDPAGDRWAPAESVPNGVSAAQGVLVGNGSVLVLGNNTAVYDVASGHWTAYGTTAAIRTRPALVSLPDGKVLAVGGTQRSLGVGIWAQPNAEVFDPAAGVWLPGGTIAPRVGFTVTSMPDGRVLRAGGNELPVDILFAPVLSVPTTDDAVQAYDPRSNTWSPFGRLLGARTNHGAVLTAGGKLLVSGGYVSVPMIPAPAGVRMPWTDAPVPTSELGW